VHQLVIKVLNRYKLVYFGVRPVSGLVDRLLLFIGTGRLHLQVGNLTNLIRNKNNTRGVKPLGIYL